jgi:hypothetical protein
MIRFEQQRKGRVNEMETINPIERECDACNAEPGEVCREGCLSLEE